MKELEAVYLYLKTLSDIQPQELSGLAGAYTKEHFRAKETIFNEGDHYTKVTFIMHGLIKKSYLTHEGKEFIKEFVCEAQITTPYASLLQKGPATYTMTALEDTSLLTIEYETIEKLFSSNFAWMKLAKAFADMHFLNREIREMELLKNSAAERYEIFKKRYPNLLNRLKKQDIACYLGITPVSLSRLESKLL